MLLVILLYNPHNNITTFTQLNTYNTLFWHQKQDVSEIICLQLASSFSPNSCNLHSWRINVLFPTEQSLLMSSGSLSNTPQGYPGRMTDSKYTAVCLKGFKQG